MGEFEACLSDPWNVAFVARPQTIGISYIDGYGKYREEELSGWHAQVFQHEYDHLNGILFVDRINKNNPFEIVENSTPVKFE